MADGCAHLLFRTRTSLSKSFSLIDCLAEDIDINVFRNDFGDAASLDDLECLTEGMAQAERSGYTGHGA